MASRRIQAGSGDQRRRLQLWRPDGDGQVPVAEPRMTAEYPYKAADGWPLVRSMLTADRLRRLRDAT